jgi:hypothetical protein
MNPYFESFADSINAGAPIPEVDPSDLRAALQFFADLRAHHAGSDETQVAGPGEYSFLKDSLARRCTFGADVLAVVMRGLTLDAIVESGRADPGHRQVDQDEVVVQAMAKMPVVAGELRDLDTIRRRLLGSGGSP